MKITRLVKMGRVCLFVMVTAGNNIELFVLDLIHKPVYIVNAATPIATQIEL